MAAGYNGNGQLNVSKWTNIKAIAADAHHTVGLREDGTVVAVGYNGYGQLKVSKWTNIKAIAAGAYHTVGLKEDGTVVAAGSNDYGQSDVSSWTNIKAIAAGAYHTVGLKEDGTAVAVGYGAYGQLKVSSWTNIMPLCEPACDPDLDLVPPLTSALVTGTLGNNGWYLSDVQVALTAADNDGGSGVQQIHCTIDGIEAVVEGGSATFAIVGDGIHAVSWYAVDNAGNKEMPPQEMSINIDKTPPTVPFLSPNPSTLWPPNGKMKSVLIDGSVADGGSGIDSTVITVDDEYGAFNMNVTGLGTVIQLEAWRKGNDPDGRLYTITAVATDRAGNQSTGMTAVLVPHDMR